MSDETKASLYRRHQDLFNEVFELIIADMKSEFDIVFDECEDGNA